MTQHSTQTKITMWNIAAETVFFVSQFVFSKELELKLTFKQCYRFEIIFPDGSFILQLETVASLGA